MAQPSSTHRERSSSHHHHRTISSTTLLLVLSLILAVLSVMLSIPRTQSTTATGATATDAAPTGILSMFSPRRNQEIIAREATVAEREAEVAKREADLLNGVPAGVTIGTCLPCTVTATMLPSPTEPVTVIREIVKEVEAVQPPWWKDPDVRVEDVLEREARVSEREKEVARREEVVGKRESDASRRETWIIENLMAAEQQPPIPVAQTEEFVTYEEVPRRPSKELPPAHIFTETKTIKNILTETVMIPEPAPTRYAAKPSPAITTTVTEAGAPTTTVEYIQYEEQTQTPATVTVVRDRMPRAQHAWYSW